MAARVCVCGGVGHRCLRGDAGVRGWVGAMWRGSFCNLADVSHERLCLVGLGVGWSVWYGAASGGSFGGSFAEHEGFGGRPGV
eukprot:3779785-Alexandrium_andersonii.AAC.1